MNPSKVQARKMVLVSTFLLLLISIYNNRKTGTQSSTFRAAWGAGVVGMMLSLLADFVPQIAGPFAVVIVLGSLTNGGEQALATALGIIGPPPDSGGAGGSTTTGPPGLTGPSGTPTTTGPTSGPPGPTGPTPAQ